MTPQEILELSEPVEAVYTDCVAQLIENICKHLGTGKNLTTQQWEIRKLSELDALTNESIKIIQAHTGKSRAEIKRAISSALGIGVRDVESILKGAVRAGKVAGVGFTAEQSDALKKLLDSLVNQAEDRANLVNTVMLNSTRNRYVWAVNNTADEEQKLIEKLMSASNLTDLNKQLGKVQEALNVATSSVEVGAESRVQALSRTVKQLAQEGITGYIDAGGHHWSPEAYMNMDIRTTIHNTYIQAQKERASEYGVDTFQITSHAGARPLCAPYQGKFYSWDGSSGVLHDLYGKEYFYESIFNTTYGQPAGIFGINCGHDPVTFVDGYNIARYEPTTDFEQNAKEYAETQKQRQLERNVRNAKLEAIAQDAAGNKEAFQQASVKVREANARYKAYCKETGRTPRNDRLQVLTSAEGNGYNRSVSSKAVWAARKADGFIIPRSLGAKARNYDVIDPSTGVIYQFVEGARVTNQTVFAGAGTKRRLKEEVVEGLTREFGGTPSKWQHAKGNGVLNDNGEERPAEVHWFQEETIGRVKFKIKRWLDES